MPPGAGGVEPPRFEPLLAQPSPCTVSKALRQHPEDPRMVDGVEAPGDGRCDDPVVSATWPLDRQGIDRIKRPHMRPVASATAQAVLLGDGWESTRDGPLHPLLLPHWQAQW